MLLHQTGSNQPILRVVSENGVQTERISSELKMARKRLLQLEGKYQLLDSHTAYRWCCAFGNAKTHAEKAGVINALCTFLELL